MATTTTYESFFKNSSESQADCGLSTITQTYIVRRLDDEVVNYNGDDLNLMMDEGIIPYPGDLYGVWDPSSLRGTWQALARCRTHSFETIDAKGRCAVTITWSTQAYVDPSTIVTHGEAIPDPNPIVRILPASMELSTQLRTSRIYRKGWSVGVPLVDGTTNMPVNESTSDIGGTSTRDIKNGLEIPVTQTRLRLRIMRDATVDRMADQWDVLKDYVGKIHARTATGAAIDPFLGFPAGSLVCDSVAMTKIDGTEYYEIVMDFLWDEFAHHDQSPTLEAWGDIKMSGTGATLKADEVKWERKPFSGVDFNNLLAAEPELLAYIERGYWTLP